MTQLGLTWDQLELGQVFTSTSRTITESDVVSFAGATADYSEIHVSQQYAESTEFGERIAHGLLGLSYAHGLMLGSGLLAGTAIAFLGLGEWRFRAPIRLQDTIHVVFEIVELRQRATRDDQGVVTFGVEVRNQHAAVVQSGTKSILLHTRPPAERVAAPPARPEQESSP